MRWRVWFDRLIVLLILLAAWQAGSLWLGDYWLSTPWSVASRFVASLLNGELIFHGSYTVNEAVVGCVIGGVPAVLLPFLLRRHPVIVAILDPFMVGGYGAPKLAFAPLFILWFGIGVESKIAMGTLSCFFPVVLSAAAGMRQIDGVLIRVGRSFRLSTSQMVTKIYLPAMREPIVNGVRLGMGVAMIGTLLAETKLSNKGIGFMIIDAYNTFDMPRMYAVLLMLFVISIGANALVSRASRS